MPAGEAGGARLASPAGRGAARRLLPGGGFKLPTERDSQSCLSPGHPPQAGKRSQVGEGCGGGFALVAAGLALSRRPRVTLLWGELSRQRRCPLPGVAGKGPGDYTCP